MEIGSQHKKQKQKQDMYIVSKVSPWTIWPRQERKNRNYTAEKPGRPRLSQAARLTPAAEGHVDITRLRKELRDASAVFPTKTHPLNLNPHVRNKQTQVKECATQWAVLFKSVKVKKNKAIPRNCHRLEKKKETYEWNEMWDPAGGSRTDNRHREKTGKIPIRSEVQLTGSRPR